MTPGPAPVHPDATAAGVTPLPHHRTPGFAARFAAVQAGLRSTFRTDGPVAVLAASGTGAVESAIVNLFARGDRVVVLASGKFGARWADVGLAYGLDIVSETLRPGAVFGPAAAAALVDSVGDVQGLVVTASETSTGTAYDVRGIVAAAREVEPDLAVVVDAITGIGALPIETDSWGLDAVCGGSQKAFMIPPGLGFVACSPRGWERVQEDGDKPRYYLDLRKYREAATRDQTPFTPATSLVLQLEAALRAIADVGGIGALESNAALLADATRRATRALGLELLAPDAPSPAVTAIKAPEPGGAPGIVAALRDLHGVQIAGGQGELKPDIFRIGHLGYLDPVDLLGTIASLERVLEEQGYGPVRGRGVAVAEEALDRGGRT